MTDTDSVTIDLETARPAEIRRLLRAAEEPAPVTVIQDPDSGDEHPPTLDNHDHYHVHPDGNAPGLDADNGHAHRHSHGRTPSDGPPVPDNDHDDHDEAHVPASWPPGEFPGTDQHRPGQAAQYRRHVRFEHGKTLVMNRAPNARLDAAWERAARGPRP